jgi:hypothetical protein
MVPNNTRASRARTGPRQLDGTGRRYRSISGEPSDFRAPHLRAVVRAVAAARVTFGTRAQETAMRRG